MKRAILLLLILCLLAGSTFTDESLRHLRIDGIQGWKLGDVTIPEE